MAVLAARVVWCVGLRDGAALSRDTLPPGIGTSVSVVVFVPLVTVLAFYAQHVTIKRYMAQAQTDAPLLEAPMLMLVAGDDRIVDPAGEYYEDYYAVFFLDPDGLKLEGMKYGELTAKRKRRPSPKRKARRKIEFPPERNVVARSRDL